MASAAEQMAANISLANFGKATELKKRIWFTLGALIIYRLGSYIPIPGIDAAELARFAAQQREASREQEQDAARPRPVDPAAPASPAGRRA